MLRQQRDTDGALSAYRDLEQFGPVVVGGQPAGVVALEGRCKVFEEAGDRDAHIRAAQYLAYALSAGDWPIDRATFDLDADMRARWGRRRQWPTSWHGPTRRSSCGEPGAATIRRHGAAG